MGSTAYASFSGGGHGGSGGLGVLRTRVQHYRIPERIQLWRINAPAGSALHEQPAVRLRGVRGRRHRELLRTSLCHHRRDLCRQRLRRHRGLLLSGRDDILPEQLSDGRRRRHALRQQLQRSGCLRARQSGALSGQLRLRQPGELQYVLQLERPVRRGLRLQRSVLRETDRDRVLH